MDNQRKKRPIYAYYIGKNCYLPQINRNFLVTNPEAFNPFHRKEYRIVDCKTASSYLGKYIAFTALISCGQTKIIRGCINDTTKELYKKVRKSLRENEPVILKFGTFYVHSFKAPCKALSIGLGTSIYTKDYLSADISTASAFLITSCSV